MKTRSRYLAQGAVIAALYVILTHLQNLLFPGSASWGIQMRLSEALCVLAFFTPAAIPGLSLGCLLFNLAFAPALPLDFLVGSAATALACRGMRRLRRFPIPALLLPGITNGLLVGLELTIYIGRGFLANALYVALGEWIVLYTLGAPLYCFLVRRGLHIRIFHKEDL